MKKLYLSITLGALLVGCTNKEAVHEPLQNELLSYTQKFEKVNRSDRYLAIATYINPVLKSSDLKERFILSSYPVEESIEMSSLKVNGDANLSVRELDYDDELLKLANINLPWSKHYEIISPEKKADYLTITYETSKNTKANLKFLKVSKSMYWSPKIELKND